MISNWKDLAGDSPEEHNIINMWIGGKGTNTGFHFDSPDNVLVRYLFFSFFFLFFLGGGGALLYLLLFYLGFFFFFFFFLFATF